jgi:hypothetical protein
MVDEMIDLKNTKKQKKEINEAPSSEESRYPWGTRLRFEKPQLDKMDVLKKADAGDKVKITAIGKVIEVSSSASENGRDHQSVEIQIQKIEIEGAAKDMASDEKDAFNAKEDE